MITIGDDFWETDEQVDAASKIGSYQIIISIHISG